MKNLSPVQACRIWSHLMDAYHGKHSYGSDTAEIYAYLFMPYSPTAFSMPRGTEIQRKAQEALEKEAAESLYEILRFFKSEFSCRVKVNGTLFGPWVSHYSFGHRCHVQIIPVKRNRP